MTAISEKNQLKKSFALALAHTGSIEQSAVLAGMGGENYLMDALDLASSPYVKRIVRRQNREKEKPSSQVRQGLERIAFGRSNDAAMLVFKEELTPYDIMSADLNNVSEIKRVKGGGVEIKFFDRQKALEALQKLDGELTEQSSAQSFFDAIKGSAGESDEQ